jgi:nucleoside-diphosphate-sugar epimerase
LNTRNEFEIVVHVSHTQTTQLLNKELYSKEKYKGYVYCVEVPNRIIYVRRNGKSVWCGNSKVASTYYIDCACRFYGMKATDIMQGVVYGAWSPEIEEIGLNTRLDSDESFGTVFNRFIVQAIIGHPLTVFGKGDHSRGFLSLNDSVQCLMLAIENEPKDGEYRTWNQLDEPISMNDLADKVISIADKFGIKADKTHIESPRSESTDNFYYNPVVDKLKNLGFKPTRNIEDEGRYIIDKLKNVNLDVLKKVVIPKIMWKK